METLEKLREGGLIDDLCSPFYFRRGEALQHLLHEMKYGGISGIGRTLGREIAEVVGRQRDPALIRGAVPVPLHRAKLRERGYNQAREVCRGIQDRTGILCLNDVLVRTRHTSTQTALNAGERAVNVRGAFAPGARAAGVLRGTTVLLVDDVVTTGATLRSCAAVLRTAGVACVVAATIAVARYDPQSA